MLAIPKVSSKHPSVRRNKIALLRMLSLWDIFEISPAMAFIHRRPIRLKSATWICIYAQSFKSEDSWKYVCNYVYVCVCVFIYLCICVDVCTTVQRVDRPFIISYLQFLSDLHLSLPTEPDWPFDPRIILFLVRATSLASKLRNKFFESKLFEKDGAQTIKVIWRLYCYISVDLIRFYGVSCLELNGKWWWNSLRMHLPLFVGRSLKMLTINV